jgi:hypothetical protein
VLRIRKRGQQRIVVLGRLDLAEDVAEPNSGGKPAAASSMLENGIESAGLLAAAAAESG